MLLILQVWKPSPDISPSVEQMFIMQHVEGWQVSRLLSNTLIYSSVWPDEVTHHILCSTTAAVECLWFHICLAKNEKNVVGLQFNEIPKGVSGLFLIV